MVNDVARKLLPGVLLLAFAALFLCQARVFSHAVGIGIDDAYIGFVYTRNLVEHGELNWTVGGERVEGYTNFLWLIVLALPHLAGWPLPPFFKALGIGCAMVGGSLVGLVAERQAGRPSLPWVGVLLVAASSNLALYAVSGIETAMFMMFVATGACLHVAPRPRPVAASIAFGLAALTRPEGMMFFALSIAHRVVERGPVREIGGRLAAFAGLVGPHLLFRRLYYGLWLPHSFYVKAGGYDQAQQWRNGFTQLRGFYTGHGAFLGLALIAAVVLHRPWGRTKVYLLLNVVVHGVYLCSIGFDFMAKHRHQVMAYPFLLPLAALGIGGLERVLGRGGRRLARAGVALLLLVGVVSMVDVDTRALRFHIDGGLGPADIRLEIGRYLAATTAPGAVIATGECGKIPYFARRAAIDLSGINDIAIGKRRPYVEVKPAPLPLAELLARRPDVVLVPSFQLGLSRQPVDDVARLSPVPTFREPAFLAAYALHEERVRDLYFYLFRRIAPGV